ncbi:MAG: flagellar biosynthetic protein FliO [Phycisphaerae bacterium]
MEDLVGQSQVAEEQRSDADSSMPAAGRGSSRYAIVARNPQRNQSQSGNGASSMTMEWGSAIGALALVLGLIFLCYWLVRRFVPGGVAQEQAGMKVIARAAVSPKQSLALVRLGQRLVMVGVSPDSMTALAEITDPDEVSAIALGLQGPADARAADVRTGGFRGLLKTASDSYDHAAQADHATDENRHESSPGHSRTEKKIDSMRALHGGKRTASEHKADAENIREKSESHQGLAQLLHRLRAMQNE